MYTKLSPISVQCTLSFYKQGYFEWRGYSVGSNISETSELNVGGYIIYYNSRIAISFKIELVSQWSFENI